MTGRPSIAAALRRYNKASDQWTYFVLPEMWKSEVCCGINGEMAAKALADRSLLKRDEKNLTRKVTLPEHGRLRIYVVSGALLEGDPD
jgi:putative DNA primase/helicase